MRLLRCFRSDVFATRHISVVEKRILMKFLAAACSNPGDQPQVRVHFRTMSEYPSAVAKTLMNSSTGFGFIFKVHSQACRLVHRAITSLSKNSIQKIKFAWAGRREEGGRGGEATSSLQEQNLRGISAQAEPHREPRPLCRLRHCHGPAGYAGRGGTTSDQVCSKSNSLMTISVLRIRDVYPGSGSWFFTHLGSRIQGSKRHRIPDSGSRIPDPGFRIPDSAFRILDSGFRIRNAGQFLPCSRLQLFKF